MNQDLEHTGFDLAALRHAAAAASDLDVSLTSFQAELEKIAAWWNPLTMASNAMRGVRRGSQELKAAWYDMNPVRMAAMDRKAATRAYAESVDPRGDWAAPWLKTQNQAPGGGSSFLNTNFGFDQLQAPAGAAPGTGIKNWWSNTTDAQKLKTLGAAGLGLGATGLAANAAMGGYQRPQINMGPTVTGM